MDHHAAVEVHVGRGIGHLFPFEAVLHAEDVMGIGDVRVEVAELLVEFPVAAVGDLDDAVLHGEGVCEILPERMVADFRRPAGEILAIEKRDPRGLGGGDGRGCKQDQEVGFHREESGVCAMRGQGRKPDWQLLHL